MTVVAHPPAEIKVELATGVRTRQEPFGYLAYVGDRDHFFAVGGAGAAVLDRLAAGARPVALDAEAAATLARVGVLRTFPETTGAPHHGVSLVGDFTRVPEVDRPLVVNCFATAFCPLRCRYCYADDLMRPHRDGERDRDIELVAEMAAAVPAMVAVVTGGEPLSRPARTRALITQLAGRKALVLDTSGVGGIEPLLPVLYRCQVHLRVSLDAVDPAANDLIRPGRGSSSAAARLALARAAEAGVPTTVQTVVTSRNHSVETLLSMRDELVRLGVRNWVLHTLVRAGKAAAPRNAVLTPDPQIRRTLADLVRASATAAVPLNIRVTANDSSRSSALIIASNGDLYVEDDRRGKVRIASPGDSTDQVLSVFRRHVSRAEHTGRYLNGSIQAFGSGLVAIN